jgi:hypothetical protein
MINDGLKLVNNKDQLPIGRIQYKCLKELQKQNFKKKEIWQSTIFIISLPHFAHTLPAPFSHTLTIDNSWNWFWWVIYFLFNVKCPLHNNLLWVSPNIRVPLLQFLWCPLPFLVEVLVNEIYVFTVKKMDEKYL